MKTHLRFLFFLCCTCFVQSGCSSGDSLGLDEKDEKNSGGEPAALLFSLDQNAPNPFKDSTLIRYKLEARLFVTLRLVHSNGGSIVLFSEVQEPGVHYYVFQPDRSLPNGLYRYVMDANSRSLVKFMKLER